MKKRTFSISVNTGGRYDGIFFGEIFDDYFVFEEPTYTADEIAAITPAYVIDFAAAWFWENCISSDQYDDYERDGIDSPQDIVDRWAWRIEEKIDGFFEPIYP